MEALQNNTVSGSENDPVILKSVFDTLMERCSCDTGDDIEQVGMSVSNFGYSINFYGDQSENHKLIVDEFGHFVKDEWVVCEPTQEQLEIMERMLRKEVDRVGKLAEQEEIDHAYALQCEADEMKYGTPGALYGKWY